MGSDTESDPHSLPKLPLFSMTIPPPHSEPSGMSTPPLQTSASVPFRWEEQPGKPRPCTDLIVAPPNKCLDLPPRLAILELESNIITKTTSPTTVLDGPLGGKSLFSSSSFRFAKERRRRQGSFDSNCSGPSGGWSPTDDDGGGLLLGSKNDHQIGGRGLFGSFRLTGGHKSTGSFAVFRSSPVNNTRMRRNSSVSKVSRSHFWAKIREGFKQVVPWRKKSKMESFTL